MPPRLVRLVLGLLITVAGSRAHAGPDDTAELMAEMLVTGTVVNDASVFTTIPRESLDASEISAISPRTMTDLLGTIAGVDVTQPGGEGGLTYVSLRGGDPNFTSVVIDGVKVDDPTNSRGGGYDFAGLDPLLVEGVDTYFGSYSSVYGSDALAGIISVTTKNAGNESLVSGILEAGTNDSLALAASLSGPLTPSAGAAMSVAHRRADDSNDSSSIERSQLVVKVSTFDPPQDQPGYSGSFFISTTDASAFPESSGGDRRAVIRTPGTREMDQVIFGGAADWYPVQNWQLKLGMGWNRYQETNINPGIAPGILPGVPPVNTESLYDRANVTLFNTVNLTDTATLGFGLEGVYEKGSIVSQIDLGFLLPAQFSLQRNTGAVFAEIALELGESATLITGIRHDDVGSISSTNARIAAHLDIPQTNTDLSFIYAEGFKLPSMFALGHSLTGNPGLQPEQSRSYSIAIRQVLHEKSYASLSVYHNRFNNLVDFDFDIFSHVNRSDVTTKGVDLGIHLEPTRNLKLSSSIGYLSSAASDGTHLELRPRWKGRLNLDWKPVQKCLITVRAYISGKYHDTAIPTGERLLDGHTQVDSGIHWAFSDKVTLKLLVDNIFNAGYETAIGFSAAGREARLTLVVQQ